MYTICKNAYFSKGVAKMVWKLEDEIEIIRQQMIDAANFEGLSADVTMELSRKLDELINHYDDQRRTKNSEANH